MRRAPSPAPDLPGYSSMGLLGSGGFADVFLYEQRLPRRKVAVKVLLAEGLGRDTRAQFVAEANLMAQLSAHPFIVTIFHADVSADGRPYFVMEYCSGPSLAERYKRERFAVADALRTGVRLAGAIATAHAAGILHRDIKPANVLTNDYGWPALTDFGISSNLEGELPVHTVTAPAEGSATTSGRSAVGMSVPWSPAEMFEDDPKPDTRSDVFSLAATVHTLLAGRTPFEIPGRSNGSLDLIGRIERGAITPIDRDDVPRSLSAVLAKGMATRRDDRYQSAVEFARALQRVELELGYAATTIEVPNLASERPGSETHDEADADATRARSVRTVEAQAPRVPELISAPLVDDDATRARAPLQVIAQPPSAGSAPKGSPAIADRADGVVDDATVVRRAGPARISGGDTLKWNTERAPDARRDSEHTVVVTRPTAQGADAASSVRPVVTAPRRGRVGLVIGIAAAVVILAVAGVAIALSGTIDSPQAVQTERGSPDDALVGGSVPAPVVSTGVASADGTTVAFEVSHTGAEEGDRYRWSRADGSGDPQVALGSTITVDGVTLGSTICIDVQVQRGSKVSEPSRGCTP